jgi:hypothetical protein
VASTGNEEIVFHLVRKDLIYADHQPGVDGYRTITQIACWRCELGKLIGPRHAIPNSPIVHRIDSEMTDHCHRKSLSIINFITWQTMEIYTPVSGDVYDCWQLAHVGKLHIIEFTGVLDILKLMVFYCLTS